MPTSDSRTGGSLTKLPFFRKPPSLPQLLALASALAAFCLWTLPNLGEFLQNAAQFPVLWQVANNRQEIIRLVIAVSSPAICALLVTSCYWLWCTIKPVIGAAKTQAPGQESPAPQPAEVHAKSTPPSTPVPVEVPQEVAHARTTGPVAAAPVVPTAAPSAQQPGVLQEENVYVSIRLLGEVSMTVHTPDGAMHMPVPLSGNAFRVQLLAYIAWLQGRKENRDKILEDVFAHGKPDEEATPQKLTQAFDSHRKLLRQDLRAVIAQINAQAGQEVLPANLDIFANGEKLWWLAPACRVPDLEAVEASYRVIEQADGQLANSVPEHVRQACESLLAAYKGDFLESLLRHHRDSFDPLAQSWARKPFTLYRDYFLDALWLLAGYELKAGQAIADPHDETRIQHFDLAARHYKTYAMRACSNRFDLKVSFARSGRAHGERVTMSERALRRALMLYGALGSTHMVDKVYTAYQRHMRLVSAEAWEPDKETLADLEAARARTSAYRLPTQIAQMPDLEPAKRP